MTQVINRGWTWNAPREDMRPDASKAESVCRHCNAVIDLISDSWIKRETDGVYCVKNPEYGQGGGKGKHEAITFCNCGDTCCALDNLAAVTWAAEHLQ